MLAAPRALRRELSFSRFPSQRTTWNLGVAPRGVFSSRLRAEACIARSLIRRIYTRDAPLELSCDLSRRASSITLIRNYWNTRVSLVIYEVSSLGSLMAVIWLIFNCRVLIWSYVFWKILESLRKHNDDENMLKKCIFALWYDDQCSLFKTEFFSMHFPREVKEYSLEFYRHFSVASSTYFNINLSFIKNHKVGYLGPLLNFKILYDTIMTL